MLNSNVLNLSIESLPGALLLCHQDGIISQSNNQAREILGLKENELDGNQLDLIIPGWKNSTGATTTISKKLAISNLINTEQTLATKKQDKSEVQIITNDSLIEIDGEHMIMVSIQEESKFIDTQMTIAKLKEQVRHALKLGSLGLLSSNIAHDFNNALLVILHNAEQAMLDLEKKSPLLPQLEEIKSATLSLTELAKQVLIYSADDKEGFEETNISQIVSEMGQLLNASFTDKLTIDYDLMSDINPIQANPSHIRQLVLNLITHATQSIQEQNSTIHISTGVVHVKRNSDFETFTDEVLAQGEYSYIGVRNDNIFPEEVDLERILNPSYRTIGSFEADQSLSTAMEMLINHQGAIQVKSRPGKGTAFTILLPSTSVEADDSLNLSDEELIEQAFEAAEFSDDYLFTDKEYYSNEEDFSEEDECFDSDNDSMALIQDYFDRPGY